ncbi:uncharacterized protein J3R85_015384 [Psidium guajava]|nr:uncharacterized protein J3R85_015384 [Psidium guajava]
MTRRVNMEKGSVELEQFDGTNPEFGSFQNFALGRVDPSQGLFFFSSGLPSFLVSLIGILSLMDAITIPCFACSLA